MQAGGRSYTLDMRLKQQGGIGSVSTEGQTFRLLRVGQELYLRADAAFWGKGGDGESDSKAADKLASKYVKVPKGDPSYTKFIGFTDKNVLLSGLLTLHGKLSTDGHHEQGGVRTVRVTGDDGAGGTLDVSLEGTPYPLRLVRAGEAGTLTFSSWGADFPLQKPAKDDTLDYGKELPTS
ncbi:Lipoprotein OS=Streptomyces albaduncus OX=68172 GN=FHS32_004903 PE=4 SV=1 [Streptomyces griseoloalbus]